MKAKILLLGFILLATSSVIAQVGIGDEAPTFKLKNIDGKMISLSDYNKEKGVIVIFTCNHCPYAKMYEERFVELNNEFSKKGFPVLALNPNNPTDYDEDSFANMIIRAKKKNFSFPYLLDDTGVYKKYGATKTPHIFLLDNSTGKSIVKYIGAMDDSPRDANAVENAYLRNAIEAVIKGESPKVAETKAVGCSIKPYTVNN